MLQKRHHVQFVINGVKVKTNGVVTLQELLQAVINPNTDDRLIFILSAGDEVVYNAAQTLLLSVLRKNKIIIYF